MEYWIGGILCLLYLHFVYSGSTSSTTLTTRYGKVKGHRIFLQHHNHLDVFLGIPYAQPPTGIRRFAHPVPVQAWSGVYDATYYRPACPQKLWFLQRYSFGSDFNDTSEDCLFLNVFTPKLDNSTTLKPVMVYIHGGGFTYGSGAEYDGRILALHGVVYVSINYRVGLMGFLSTGDKFAPGNQGHLDQIEALRWVQNNIRVFGGDPSKVTIFGQSSGGASVSSHLFSPLAKGLFRSVIAHSGVALSPFAFVRAPYKAVDTARDLGIKNGCHNMSTEQLVTCLSNKPIVDLLKTSVKHPPMTASYVPVVDGYYINDLPEVLLAKGEVNDLPLMTGTVPDETADELESVTNIENGISRNHSGEMVRKYCRRYGNKSDDVDNALHCQYNLDNTDPVINRENVIAFESDYGYHAPHIKLVDAFHKIQPNTFSYSFEYRSQNEQTPLWEDIPHSTELYYVFGCPYTDRVPCPWKLCLSNMCKRKVNQLDKDISQKVMTMWTNFAKHSSPNPLLNMGLRWPKYGSEGSYLRIGPVISGQQKYRDRQMGFWNGVLPSLLRSNKSYPCPGSNIVG